MYTLSFITNNDECYWYEVFDKLIDAVRAAHEYGNKDDLYQIFDSQHTLILVGIL